MLIEAILRGEFQIHENGIPLKDPALLRPILERSVPPSLQRLTKAALLSA